MDTLSHALYGKGLFGYRKYRWSSFFFGVVPDIFSFGIYFLFLIFFSESDFGKPTKAELPVWVYELYNISHSMITASFFITIAYFIKKEFAWPMLAWPMHIIVDFFTHSIEFFQHQYFGQFLTTDLMESLGQILIFSFQILL